MPELHVSQDVLEHLCTALLTQFGYRGGMSAHLAGIEADSGPVNAHAVAVRYGAYPAKARTDLFYLGELGTELAPYAEAAPGLDLQSLGVQLVRAGGKIIDGGNQLIRFRDLSQIADGQNVGVYPFMPQSRHRFPAADPYTIAEPPREMRLYMETELANLSLAETWRLLNAAAADQEARFAFWAVHLGRDVSQALLARVALRREQARDGHAAA